MVRQGLIFLFFLAASAGAAAQPPAGYYVSAEGKTGNELKQSLHNIISGHSPVTYTDLWTHFQTTDARTDGKVWDMYSDKPGLTPAYLYTFVINQCGNYSKEGDCYNREHSFPKSWFGGEVMPMYTDLFHLYPTDGWVNNKRGNYPFGEVSSATWTSTNGSKLGNNTWPGYSGTVFEPIDAYKGDFARTILYMAVRYYGEDGSWPQVSDMVDGAEPKAWAIAMLLSWHNTDPVSPKETSRNNTVYGIQYNRNPFIDKPEYAQHIWGDPSSSELYGAGMPQPVLYPVPSRERVTITLPESYEGPISVSLLTLAGSEILRTEVSAGTLHLDLASVTPGIYLISIKSGRHTFTRLLPVIR